jgi:hypothetical protein
MVRLHCLAILFLTALLTSSCASHRSKVTENIFGQYEGQEGVISFRLPPGLFLMMIGHEDPEFRELIKKIDRIKIIIIDKEAYPDSTGNVYNQFAASLRRYGFQDLMVMSEGGQKMDIKYFGAEDLAKELMFLISEEDSFLGISMVGNIDLAKAGTALKKISASDFGNLRNEKTGQ